MQSHWLVVPGLSSNHRTVCVPCRRRGEAVRLLPDGLFWVFLSGLQRYGTLPRSFCTLHSLTLTRLKVTLTLPPPPVLCPLSACNCDPMGSVSMQCHNNGTCRCRQGFVGYKCDKCELNYFHNRASHQCEECPVCYGLVKKQVSWRINQNLSTCLDKH